MKTIKLSNNVRVSDPCYSDDVWCKTRLTDVHPGDYNVITETSDEGEWGNRISRLTVIHSDYKTICEDESKWEEHSDIGVDSGQAGIFCETSYRNDEIAESITTPPNNFKISGKSEGDKWYEKMCDFTLSNNLWGSYDTGVVTSSGYGDGGYPLEVVRNDNKEIVGMRITYIFPEDDEEDYDVCPECGGEMDFGDEICESCQNEQDYNDHIENQEN